MYLYYMDEKLQILLGSCRNINSVNVDNFHKIELENKESQILEYDVKNALSATEIFDAEREASDIYRIYGRLEYLSLLNGLKLNYSLLQDFFLPQTTNCKNIFNSFDFYLLKAGTGYTSASGNMYVRYFDVITKLPDFELYNAGFSNNVYGDQVYGYSFNQDFDVSQYADSFGFPATELFLYAQYKPTGSESMLNTLFSATGIPSKAAFTPVLLNPGAKIYGDLIEYNKSEFNQVQSISQTYYINTPYNAGVLQWRYNPIIPFRLKYFYNTINYVNTGSTSYEQQITIPYYATSMENGNFVWRDIIPQGNIDPLTGLGVNYPFINNRRYLFAPIILDISPNLSDPYTSSVFAEIKYGVPSKINTNPVSDLDNIGKPCL